MSALCYAIGDVHGRDDMLAAMHDRIREHHARRHSGRPAKLVHIGDYIDRGPESVAVIDRLMSGIPPFEVVCLKGNHEDMLLTCLETDNPRTWSNWLGNGGDATLQSLGIALEFGEYDPEMLANALGDRRIAWLRQLALYHLQGDYLFVHAGIVPGRPLEEQHEQDLLWIREGFLDSKADHGFRVVHGHTPSRQPEVRANRICIDTGANWFGVLTAVVVDGFDEPEFIMVDGPTDKEQRLACG